MRDGNKEGGGDGRFVVTVVSLPMRDGNYLLYHCFTTRVKVVSLPMRDGNPQHDKKYKALLRLLAYL